MGLWQRKFCPKSDIKYQDKQLWIWGLILQKAKHFRPPLESEAAGIFPLPEKQEHQLVPTDTGIKPQHTCTSHLYFELKSQLEVKNYLKSAFFSVQ